MNTFSPFRTRFPRWSLSGVIPVLLPLLAAVLLPPLRVSIARGALRGQNTLSLGTASGESGTDVVVPLDLTNQDAVGGIQLDVLFDPAVVSFTGAVSASRAAGMSIGSSIPAAGRLRVLMYFVPAGGAADSIAAGTGAIADLTFHVVGTGGTDLTPDAAELSSRTGQELSVTATAGRITVTGGTDTLAIGSGSGPTGGQITIPVELANHVAVRGIQVDLRIDSAVLRFESGAATPRVGRMHFDASPLLPDTLRILMYYDSTSILAPGRGAVANLVFRIIGGDGSRSSLTPDDIVVADVHDHEIPTVGSAGEVLVIGGAAPPDLRLAVLRNPGRTRTLQIFVGSDVALDAPPTVGLSGGVAVPMNQLPGLNLFRGSISVVDGTASVTVQATGIHEWATGTAQSTVTF
jgi:hypothetical protein